MKAKCDFAVISEDHRQQQMSDDYFITIYLLR